MEYLNFLDLVVY